MKHIVLLAALLAPYCVSASATGSFDFDIPEQAKNRAAKDLAGKVADPATSKVDIMVVKPGDVKVNELPSKQPRVSVVIPVAPAAKPAVVATGKPVLVVPVEVKPVVPVEVKPALPLPTAVAKSTPEASTVAPLKPAPAAVVKPAPAVVAKAPVASPVAPAKVAAPVAAAAVIAAAPAATAAGKEVYRTEEVSKNSTAPKQVAKAGKLCSPTTIAMTFHNVPTQKGPYFHRWVSLGCEADEVNFVREGNEQYSMNWQLSYVPADEHETARYALRWKVKGKDDKGAPVDYEARHTFNLDNARTLSLTNNMAVSLRKVP